MPMYYPDLESVQDCVKAMRKNKGEKRYNGIYPETEEQLAQARSELGKYFRTVWGDKIQAMEVELAVNRDNYYEKIGRVVSAQLFDMFNKKPDPFPYPLPHFKIDK